METLVLVALIVAWVVFGLTVIYFAVGAVLASKLLRPKKRTDEYLAVYESKEKGLDLTRLDIPYEDIRLKSRNEGGYTVRGRFYDCGNSKKTVLDIHGYNSSSLSQLKYLHIWRRLGYNVLAIDNTTSGESGGSCIGLSYLERRDALMWLDYLKERFPDHTFGIYGESMGGATAIATSARTSVPLMFTISYCAYANIKKLIKDQFKARKIPSIALMFVPAFYAMANLFYGVKISDVDSVRDIKSVNNPILLMHSKGDRLIDISHFEMISAVRPDATVKVYESSPHCRSWKHYPAEFENAVMDFVKSAERFPTVKAEYEESKTVEAEATLDAAAATETSDVLEEPVSENAVEEVAEPVSEEVAETVAAEVEVEDGVSENLTEEVAE